MIIADTTPYPWPYSADFHPAKSAVVVCGADLGWTERSQPDLTVTTNILKLQQLASKLGVLVITVHHPQPQGYTTSPNPGVSTEIAPNERHIDCAGIDALFGSPLESILHRKGCSQLLLVGYGLETTVHSTMRSANDRGFECLLVSDACAPCDPTLTNAAISTIEMSGGIFGAIGTTHNLLAAWRQRYEQLNQKGTL